MQLNQPLIKMPKELPINLKLIAVKLTFQV
jgi:hypothetical protein